MIFDNDNSVAAGAAEAADDADAFAAVGMKWDRQIRAR